MKISILTATYNRAECLDKLYNSIINNLGNNYEVEWLIMDDGSTDKTELICKRYTNMQGVTVQYYKQNNKGKMAAINNLAQYVKGDLWIECDSDDYFEHNSFEKIICEYNKIKNKNNIYAMAFLKKDHNGNNMGNNFKNEENTMFDLYFKEHENGEKALVFITEIRKKYKYELEHDEKFITEARMYHKMDKDYKIKCVNETIMVCEYQEGGYSKNISNQFLTNPFGYYKYFYEILADMDTRKILFSKRIYTIKHYILFTYLTHEKLNLNVRGIRNKLLIILLYIPGIIQSGKYKKITKVVKCY